MLSRGVHVTPSHGFISGVILTHHLAVSMAAESIASTYLRAGIGGAPKLKSIVPQMNALIDWAMLGNIHNILFHSHATKKIKNPSQIRLLYEKVLKNRFIVVNSLIERKNSPDKPNWSVWFDSHQCVLMWNIIRIQRGRIAIPTNIKTWNHCVCKR